MHKYIKCTLVISIKFFIFCCAISQSFTVNAQLKKDISKSADRKFYKKNYADAAQAYIKALSLEEKNDTIVGNLIPLKHKHTKHATNANSAYLTYQLAESFRLDHNYQYAQKIYEKCFDQTPIDYPLLRFWYAVCLKANNHPEKAIEQLNIFLQKHRENDEYTKQAKLELITAKSMMDEKNHPTRTAVTKLPAPFNLDDNSFGLQKLNDSMVIFSSSRADTIRKRKIIFPLKIYSGNLFTNTISPIEINTKKYDVAASSLSLDGLTLYFTSWTNKNINSIFYVTRPTIFAPWSSPILMDYPVNEKGYSSKHPYITKDGKTLLFASDRLGSFGKFDIWMVRMANGKPISRAINLGRNINTSGEEASPFYDDEHQMLYFSSDSKTGFGGLDIYRDSGDIKTNKWTANENLGYPINSARDELYYTRYANSDTVYFSSNRESTSNILDIYSAVEVPVPVETTPGIKDDNSSKQKEDTTKTNQPTPSSTNNAETDSRHLLDSINSLTIARLNTYYSLNSAEQKKNNFNVLDSVVNILKNNPDLNILVASFGDCKGSAGANARISRARSRSVRAYLRKHGIHRSRINLNFFGKRHNVLPCKDDSTYRSEEQILNRRSDLIITKEKNPKWRPSGKEVDLKELINRIKNGKEIDTNDEQNLSRRDKRKLRRVRKERNKKIKLHAKLNSISTDEYDKFNDDNDSKEPMTENEKNYATLDSLESVRVKGNIDEMLKRIPKPPIYLFTNSDSIHIELYDNGVFDNDSISVIFNKKIIVLNQILQVDEPISFYIKVDTDESKNIMVFFAENLGLIPPNSALMVITDGEGKRTEVSVNNDLFHNTLIYFVKGKKT